MNAIRCREIPTALADVLGGEASADLGAAVDRHLAYCQYCAATHRDLSAIIDRARGTALEEPPETYWREFLPALRRRLTESEPVAIPWTAWIRPLAAAAALTVIVLLAPQPHTTPDTGDSNLENLHHLATILDPTGVGYDTMAWDSSNEGLTTFADYPTSAPTGDVFAFYELALELGGEETERLMQALAEDKLG